VSSPSSWHPAARHASVFGITVGAIACSLLIALVIEPSYFLPLTAAVVACSWLFGWDGGIHATLVGAALADFFLMPPRYTFALADRRSVVGLLVFIAIGLLLTWLTSSLRSARELHISILEGMSDALVVTDKRGYISYLNPAAQALIGLSSEAAKNQEFEKVFPLRDEATGENRSGLISKVLLSSAPQPTAAQTMLTATDGTEYSVEESAAPIRGSDGRVSGGIVVLRNTTRRRQMQEQLTQSQKMEAIGRMAGGVAGDFNNLLTVITGFGELLTSDMAVSNPLRRFAEEILHAAERAAELTRQLLAFGKGASVPARPHDLNALVTNMETMLSRVLGSSIELIVLAHSRSLPIKTDPSQIEQIVVNLAMNARDAMPKGGKFIIETSEVEIRTDTPGRLPDLQAGQWVMLAITDNGVGMDADTKLRLFEPFFTTKLQGRGSGLGLSIVYGIVSQHGGHISVYSQPGAGTIFEIYFPREKEGHLEPVARQKTRGPRGTETILVAEDEESVRKLVLAVLGQSGYTVIEARDGKEALELFEKHRERVDMVLTDIVMPQLNGFELGSEIQKIEPRKKVLFMSGYRDAYVGTEDGSARPFLNKPFTPEALLKQVREVLDGRASGEKSKSV
jgi:two-component system cell cycle sensor histidine kinase/response regulator CckA